ncbi:MAG: serine hydrolase [Ignavibacteriales bacterium]|nr:serine hydrolase [Ignavibacteriales bacterium]
MILSLVLTLILIPSLQDTSMSTLRESVMQEFKSVKGTFALAYSDLSSGSALLINEKETFHAASTMKTPVMIEVFKQARAGKFGLDDSILVKNEFKSIVDGSPYQMDLSEDSDDSMYRRINGKATVRELLYQMITVSSNLATNILIDLVDAKNVTASMRNIGAWDILVLRGVEDGKAYERGLNNTTTAYDLMVIMKTIAEGKAVDQVASKEMTGILLDQKFRDQIPALLPDGVRVAHKTGSITGVRHDSGFVILPDGRTYVVVVLSKGLEDEEAGKRVMARISRLMYDYTQSQKP